MGRATALTFAREGALVVGCDVAVDPAAETVELVQAAGGQMVSLQPCRVSEPAECARLVGLAINSYGRIDVLYNLAARSHFNRLEDFGDADWEAARRDEVDLVFYLTRAAWPSLKATGGVVLNMASLNGSLSFKLLPSLAHTTNKSAVIGMSVNSPWKEVSTAYVLIRFRRGLSKPTLRRANSTIPSSVVRWRRGRSLVVLANPRTSPTQRCTSSLTRVHTSRGSTW
jgi:NAD(P)-dependent dehydrogenase (short-subunit alcohol dehydrogenase family)